MLAYWDNIVGPKIEQCWSRSAREMDEELLLYVARHTLNGEIVRPHTDEIEPKFYVLGDQGRPCAPRACMAGGRPTAALTTDGRQYALAVGRGGLGDAAVAIATFNFTRGTTPAAQNKYSLSFLLPTANLSRYFVFNPILQARVPLIIRRFRTVPRKVPLPTLWRRGRHRRALTSDEGAPDVRSGALWGGRTADGGRRRCCRSPHWIGSQWPSSTSSTALASAPRCLPRSMCGYGVGCAPTPSICVSGMWMCNATNDREPRQACCLWANPTPSQLTDTVFGPQFENTYDRVFLKRYGHCGRLLDLAGRRWQPHAHADAPPAAACADRYRSTASLPLSGSCPLCSKHMAPLSSSAATWNT